MDLKNLAMNFFHPFIIYGIFGSGLMFLLVWAIIKFFKVDSPKIKAKLMLLPIALPFIAYFAEAVFYRKCLQYLQHDQHLINVLSNWICKISIASAGFLGPLFGGFVALVILKITVSNLALWRLISKHGYTDTINYPELKAVLDDLSLKAGITPPRVVITESSYAQAFTFGLRQPVIVLSQATLVNLEKSELEAIVAHELAHIVRKDTCLLLIGSLSRDLLFFAPPVLLAFNRFSEEKEKAADDLAITLTGNPLALAGALIKIWRLTPKSLLQSLSLNPAFVRRTGSLEVRIRRLMDGSPKGRPNSKIFPLALTAGLLVLLTLAVIC